MAATTHALDRDALHRCLYRRADHFGRLKVDLQKLASELDIAYTHLSRVITSMANEGRLRRIGGTSHGQKTYVVTDPATWQDRLSA